MAQKEGKEAKGTTKKKKLTLKQQKEEERQEREKILSEQIEVLNVLIGNNEGERGRLHFPELEGRTITHSQYGEGRVVSQMEDVLTIQYGDITKKQKLPIVLLNGCITGASEEEIDECRKIDQLEKEHARLKRELDNTNIKLTEVKAQAEKSA